MTTAEIQYGPDLPGDSELRLAGDLSDGKRAIELGVSNAQNAIAFALAGARAIAVDTDAERIDRLRRAAADADVHVQCHTGDLADLGFATSGSVELVVARQSLVDVDDLSRTLRQVNRVLRASRPLILTVPHPFAEHLGGQRYGSAGRTIGDWFTQLSRSNFRVDQILELGVSGSQPLPTTLLVRAHKEGD